MYLDIGGATNGLGGLGTGPDELARGSFPSRGIVFNDLVQDQPITIRLADTDGQRNAASVLLNRMYGWRGYGDHHVIARSPSHTTFTASSHAGVTLGTITLAVDSPHGLGVDKLFKDEIDEFRSAGAKVCELTRFAVDLATPSKPVLASLFHLIFIYGSRTFGCSDLFIEVNPRHVRFYEVMLGFTKMAQLRMNADVSAPSQLLWLSVERIRAQIDERGDSAGGAVARSLYPHFFSPREEDGLFGRMMEAHPSFFPLQHAAMHEIAAHE